MSSYLGKTNGQCKLFMPWFKSRHDFNVIGDSRIDRNNSKVTPSSAWQVGAGVWGKDNSMKLGGTS
jgi:hypothetical protein